MRDLGRCHDLHHVDSLFFTYCKATMIPFIKKRYFLDIYFFPLFLRFNEIHNAANIVVRLVAICCFA